ncbi:MAG TPA: tRNA lysidine(34) synthetase TilS [Pirellulaceae bacterium]|nr:tRNA lysidine(34) synthetase TilS [Pirellulaceae bacterium]
MRRFEERLSEAWPPGAWLRVPVVVAVSGGADSVALLRGLVSLAEGSNSALVAAHFNHRLRPDSGQDADFVGKLCGRMQVRCELGVAVDELAAVAAGGIEEAARDARYEFLAKIARQVGARYVATAHTADDQTETILHRIVRGTGIRGLAGIPVSRELVPGITLIRPLLAFQRSEIVDYLGELGQPYRNDSSNSDERFTRNRIRHALLPTLRDAYNPNVDESLRRLGMLAEEISTYVEFAASELLNHCVRFSANEVSIDLNQLVDVPPLIVRTMLRQIWRTQAWPEREMTFERWHALEQLARQEVEPVTRTVLTLPGNIRVEREESRINVDRALRDQT